MSAGVKFEKATENVLLNGVIINEEIKNNQSLLNV